MITSINIKNLGTVNKNYVSIKNTVEDKQIEVWFSYNTPVAFSYQSYKGVQGLDGTISEFQVRQNEWSTTTGKLLNELQSDKSKRIDGALFEEKLSFYLSTI